VKMAKTSEGTILDLYVKPQSKEFRIQIEQNELLVHCRETPVKGRVNRELIKELTRLFKKRVDILSGFTSRQKRILIRDANPQEINEILHNVVATDTGAGAL